MAVPHGPMRRQLAEMVADGGLTDDQLVKPFNSDAWQRVDSVIGLERAARKLREERPSDVTSNVAAVPKKPVVQPKPDANTEPVVERVPEENASSPGMAALWVRIVFLLIVGLLLVHAYSQWSFKTRFPIPDHLTNAAGDWKFPLVGHVTGMEYLMICVDVVVVAYVACRITAGRLLNGWL